MQTVKNPHCSLAVKITDVHSKNLNGIQCWILKLDSIFGNVMKERNRERERERKNYKQRKSEIHPEKRHRKAFEIIMFILIKLVNFFILI
jgi:hypothetical protein